MNGPVEDPTKRWSAYTVTGQAGRYHHSHPNTDFEQPRTLFKKVMSETDRQHLIENLSGALSGARRDIQERMVKLFYRVDPEYGERVAKGINLQVDLAKL